MFWPRISGDSVNAMADELGANHEVEDFTLIGRAYGYVMPGFWMFMALLNVPRVIESLRNHRTSFGWFSAIAGVGTGVFALYLFRSVRAVCHNGVLSISQRRVPTVTCPVASIARLNVSSGASATLLNDAGDLVLRFDRRMMLPSDLARLAAKLDVPYTQLADGPFGPPTLGAELPPVLQR
jgi:hypothetical protein